MNSVDARGLACPEPVLLCKRALEKGAPLTVIVDNGAAKGNVSRFARNAGYQVEVKPAGEDFEIVITK